MNESMQDTTIPGLNVNLIMARLGVFFVYLGGGCIFSILGRKGIFCIAGRTGSLSFFGTFGEEGYICFAWQGEVYLMALCFRRGG